MPQRPVSAQWFLAACLACVFPAVAHAADGKPRIPADHAGRMQQGLDLFKTRVRGLLTEHCLECHGGKSKKADLDLATRETLMASGMVEPEAQASALYRSVAHLDEPHMPYKRPKLKEDAVAAIGRWIDLGSPYDRPLIERGRPAAASKEPMQVTDADRSYWAFRPLRVSAPPQVHNGGWLRTPIDRFILAGLESQGLHPVGDADRRTLIRRISFDLIGLPPEPDEVAAFVSAPDFEAALKSLVDRLLAGPHFGERWARHWLDPARFAESHGFEHDTDRPFAYHYRDFVIRAFNEDMPYDRFLRLQLAGDELEPENPMALAATGFLGAGVFPTQITNREAERIRYDAMDDMLATTGLTMLGVTVGCARCHDHKYDPIPTRDYYQMLSAFTTTVRTEVDWDFGSEAEKAAMRAFEARLQPLVQERDRYESQDLPRNLLAWLEDRVPEAGRFADVSDSGIRKSLDQIWDGRRLFSQLDKKAQDALLKWFRPRDAGWVERDEKIKDLEGERPVDRRTKIQACTEGLKPMRLFTADKAIPDFYPHTYLLRRGDVDQKEGEAPLGFLRVLMRDDPGRWRVEPPPKSRTSFRRASLASWMTDTEAGAGHLAARVIVNRLWHYHFGRGLVATINDFGVQGDTPSHPELLDWLALDLIHNGWSLKRLHRQMVLSHVYRLSGEADSANHERDPDNCGWWHRPRRRLEAEIIRDNLLAVSGLLDRSMFGPGTLDESMRRRSLYFTVKRSQMIPLLQVFDWPDALTSAGARPTTVTAPQALVFLNNPQVRQWAAAFAARLQPAAEISIPGAVDQAFRIAFGRPPTADEQQAGVEFVSAALASHRGRLDRALTDYALALMSLNEFIYVD